MGFNYHLRPSPEIYGCLVDMLSRNGYLEDAKLVIEAMPFPTWPALWRTLLSGLGHMKIEHWGNGLLGGCFNYFRKAMQESKQQWLPIVVILFQLDLISSDFLRQLKTQQLLDRAKRRFDVSRRSTKVTAFYGLKNPPYKLDALEPYMSKRTIDVHWGELHQNFVEGLNKQLEKDGILYGYTMDELVKETFNNGNPLPEFNNAAEVWNHDFFCESMQPGERSLLKLPSHCLALARFGLF
ncbi:hypothetical protein K1719_042562 [Acacia pycnantha]|nr:hypothetical protein K1719_042562 [Acacia pycnantha]